MVRMITGVLLAMALAGCAKEWTVVGEAGWPVQVRWTEAERAAPMAVRTTRANEWGSYHIALLNAAEKKHVHDRHDLTIVVLSGRVRMHMGDQVSEVGPGAVIEVPHGLDHWAEPVGGSAEAYLVFTPPFDGEDRRAVE